MKLIRIAGLLMLGLTSLPETQAQLTYPNTRKTDVVEDYHGTKVADPYRWLENDTSAETKAWVIAENEVTNSYLSKIPYRNKIRDRINELLNYPRYSAPFSAGKFYIYSKNDGLQNQSVYYRQDGLTGEPTVFLDPNTLAKDGTASAGFAGVSGDKKYIAYTVSRAGSDWSEMRIREVATGNDLPDVIQYVKFSGAAFVGNGFFYSRYPSPEKGQELSGQNKFHSIYYHQLGDKQERDRLIFIDKANPLRYHSAYATEDENFLVLSISEGTDGNETWIRDLKAGEESFHPLISGFDFVSNVVDNEGDKLLIHTNIDAPNYRLVLIDPKNPAKANWKNIIPESANLLKGVSTCGGKLFAEYLKDVNSQVFQYDRTGKMEHEIALPGVGAAGGFGGYKEDTFCFYTYTSFNYPPTIFKYDIASGKSTVFRKSEVKFNPEDYEVKQVFAPSKDGAKVPMFIVHKKGLKLDGQNPTLLYAYGGFNVSLVPGFSATRIPFLENGGVYVMANLRGGGEYGETWHRAGMMEKKQNVFDDFIACAEWLQANKYTSKEKLAIQGGSNGGLLIGAVMTQRPDLFAACIPQVGVMDMLRFQKFTVGWGWVDEYGSSEDAKMFPILYGYSPLHNIKEVSYPATMVMTADHDDRVVPAHSFKFIATLQEKNKGANPVLIRIETNAGHGAGTALSKSVEQAADIYSFIFFATHSPVN